MIHISILLIWISAMITLLFTNFVPSAISQTGSWLNELQTSQIFTTTEDVALAPVTSPIDFAEIEQPVADTTIYLPVVMNNIHTYSGIITDNGVPAPDQEVDLRFYDGSVWSTYDTQVTNPSGAFYFTNLPILSSGQAYYVRWFNNLDNPDHLGAYYCDTIDIDNIDSGLLTCDINIHNVFHVSPDNAAIVRLPKTFEWTLRPTTSDSYEFNISDTNDDNPWWWTDPPLGYTNTYRLTSLPTGFQTNVEYGWFMGVYGVNGMGFSYYYRTITFQNTGNVVIGPESPIDNLGLLQRKERDMIPPVKVQ
jgi:hypothetical protein